MNDTLTNCHLYHNWRLLLIAIVGRAVRDLQNKNIGFDNRYSAGQFLASQRVRELLQDNEIDLRLIDKTVKLPKERAA